MVRPEAEIEKIPCLIRLCHWIATENIILQNTWKRPSGSAIGGIPPAALSKVGVDIIELPPGDRHLIAVCRVNGNSAFVGSIADDVLTIGINVYLVTHEWPEN
ncbi:MAG: hypothetical protein DME48_05865 [Verrucomicrobia bacterium]|nr:MAG: hypothetical protein DME48_05865 [Verrucomicrobiota bacterium]